MNPDKTGTQEAPRKHQRVLSKSPTAPGQPAEQVTGELQLPNERDESTSGDATAGQGTGAAGEGQRRMARRAAADLAEGQVDTDMHATPGLDADQRRKAVADPSAKRRA